MEIAKIRDILGPQASLLEHQCKTIAASQLGRSRSKVSCSETQNEY